MEDYAIIYNPTAAAGKSKADFELACKTLDHLNVKYRLAQTDFFGHAIDLAKELAKDGYIVIGAGGDGTCNEVFNGVFQSNTNTPIGFIPMGSGNDIPGAIGIKPDIKRACEIIAENHIAPSDIGKATNYVENQPNIRYFLGIGSQGFDAEVTRRTNEGKKRFNGTWNYIASVLRTLFFFKRQNVRVTFDSEVFEGQCNLVAVGNGSSYGGWMYMCPQAQVDDGLFHISIVNMGNFTLLYNFNKMYSKTLHPHPQVHEFISKTVKIEMLDTENEPFIAQVDGEIMGKIPIEYEAISNGYEFIRPPENEVTAWFMEKYGKKYTQFQQHCNDLNS